MDERVESDHYPIIVNIQEKKRGGEGRDKGRRKEWKIKIGWKKGERNFEKG